MILYLLIGLALGAIITFLIARLTIKNIFQIGICGTTPKRSIELTTELQVREREIPKPFHSDIG